MPELGSLGSVRGALSDERPYRECENSRFARKRARSERIFAIDRRLIAQNAPNFHENWIDQLGFRVFTRSARLSRIFVDRCAARAFASRKICPIVQPQNALVTPASRPSGKLSKRNSTSSRRRGVRADILATRHLRDHRAGLLDRRQNPNSVFFAPPPTPLVTRDQCHPTHAVQLASLIKPT